MPRPQPSAADRERVQLLIGYTAALNPRGVRRLIYQHGYAPEHAQDLPRFLLGFLQTQGEPAMDALLSIHPDRELLMPDETTALTAQKGGLSAFAGPETTAPATSAQTVAYQLARAIDTNKRAVVDVVNRHGAAVLYSEARSAVANQCALALLTNNPVFVRELAALTPSPAEFTTAWGNAVTEGVLTNGATQLLGEVTISMGPDLADVSTAKRNLGIALGAVTLALLLALAFIFFHRHLRGGSN